MKASTYPAPQSSLQVETSRDALAQGILTHLVKTKAAAKLHSLPSVDRTAMYSITIQQENKEFWYLQPQKQQQKQPFLQPTAR